MTDITELDEAIEAFNEEVAIVFIKPVAEWPDGLDSLDLSVLAEEAQNIKEAGLTYEDFANRYSEFTQDSQLGALAKFFDDAWWGLADDEIIRS